MLSDSTDNPEPLWVRPRSDFYAFIVLVAICGVIVAIAMIFAARSSTQSNPMPLWAAFALGGALFWLPCLLMLWLMRRLCLVADACGLWFRGLWKKRHIPWRDIEDYELRPSPQSGSTRFAWICHDKKWRRLPQGYAHQEELRARIQVEAQWSRAQEWQLGVERADGNWPKTYAYRDPSGRKTFALIVVAMLFVFGVTFGQVLSPKSLETTRLIWNDLEWWGRAGSVLMPILVLFLFALWILPHYSILRAKQNLGQQIISADRDALTLIDGETQTRIAWHEVTDYFIEDAPGALTLHQAVVESAHSRIVFRHEIENINELKALIRSHAVNAKSDDWRARESADSDTLGGKLTLWPSGEVGVGRKVYHYRTRTMRALLVLGGAMLLVLPIRILGLVPLREGQLPTTPDRLIGLVFVAPVVALAVGGALAFWRASIQTDETGIYQRGVWSERALRWSEIEAFTFNGYFYALKGADTTMRWGAVAASDTLQAEIETRGGAKLRRTDRAEA